MRERHATSLGVSAAVALMAVAVLVGWHAHIVALVRILPGFNLMQYNTALSFLALGAAGIGLSTGRRWLALAGGMDAYLSKPIEAEALCALVEQHLRAATIRMTGPPDEAQAAR